MGKRILQRRRGKAGIQFRAPSRGKVSPVRYPRGEGAATVTAILDERGRSAPLAQIRLEGDRYAYLPAVAGMTVGQQVSLGQTAQLAQGNVMPLSTMPEGTRVCNIELRPGDGGRLVRASGTSAVLFSMGNGRAILKMPSGKIMLFFVRCGATVGEVAGGGRREKPFLTAGARHHAMRAAGRVYPRMRGVAMAVVYHPFGGGRHQHPGKSTSTSRNAPPGRMVGLIAPRKTRRKRLPRASAEVSG